MKTVHLVLFVLSVVGFGGCAADAGGEVSDDGDGLTAELSTKPLTLAQIRRLNRIARHRYVGKTFEAKALDFTKLDLLDLYRAGQYYSTDSDDSGGDTGGDPGDGGGGGGGTECSEQSEGNQSVECTVDGKTCVCSGWTECWEEDGICVCAIEVDTVNCSGARGGGFLGGPAQTLPAQ